MRNIVVSRYGIGDLREAQAVDRLRCGVVDTGLVVFGGVRSTAIMLETATAVMQVVSHPDSGEHGVTTLLDRGPGRPQSNSAGFSRRGLAPHTDRSGVPDPPALLMTVCVRPARAGGSCILVDGKAVHDDLVESAPDAVAALLAPRTVLFGGITGHAGSVLTDLPPATGEASGGRRALRLRLDDLAMFTTAVAARVPVLCAAIERHTLTVDLAPGEGYLLDNHRWLHGRTSYEGMRIVRRLLGDPLSRLGMRPGIPVDPAGRQGTAASAGERIGREPRAALAMAAKTIT